MAAELERILLTGAAGHVGATLRAGLAGLAARLRVSDVRPLGPVGEAEEAVQADLRDLGAVTALLGGVDAAVHLGGLPGEDAFERVLDHNVRGSAHVLEAARLAGTRRVVFASSSHASGYYPAGEAIAPDVPHRPDGLYGWSKCAVEDLGRLYHDKFGLEVVCVRIGTFAPRPRSPLELATWLSPRDAIALFRRCLLADGVGFAVVYGISANRRRVWPLATGLGYQPGDDAERYAADVGAGAAPGERYQGGPFTRAEETRFA